MSTTELQMSTTQKDKQTEVLRFRADSALTKRIDKLAKAKFTKRSEIIREAIVAFVKKEEAAA